MNDAQIDAIQEAINIGVGRAAAALNDLVDRPVMLVAPSVELLSFEELPRAFDAVGPTTVSSVQMGFHGSLEGSFWLSTAMSQPFTLSIPSPTSSFPGKAP